MKRQFTLLLASVLVVFALTACGGNDKDTNHDNNGQNTVGEDIQNAGEDIMDAFDQVDVLSKSAQIYINAKCMGFEPDGMTPEQMKELSVTFNLPK